MDVIDQSIDFGLNQSLAMATAGTTKRKPVFVKVEQLKPGTNGHTLTVKVVSSNPVKSVNNKGSRSSIAFGRPSRPTHISECLLGDETGTIIFTARNEQGMYYYVNISNFYYHCVIFIDFISFRLEGHVRI